MYPPTQGLDLDIEALSGICGSISIACWVVVFSPQIIENFRRSSAEGLSIVFIVIWLVGDIFNILGAVLQGVLPTMIILAIYYTLADIVLLGQCFYYRGFTLKDEVKKPANGHVEDGPDERRPLLSSNRIGEAHTGDLECDRAVSPWRERLLSLDGTHLSPVTPLHPEDKNQPEAAPEPTASRSLLQAAFFNSTAILLVCLAGIFGWWLSNRSTRIPHQGGGEAPPEQSETLRFNILGQVFGYICAALYLGSRVPQLLLNYRRKSTEGISMLFFLFACVGNLTYVMSILAYSPVCQGGAGRCELGEQGKIYARYIAVNFSWLLGSFGTLLLDAGVFVQFFMYRVDEESDVESLEDEDTDRVGREDRRGVFQGDI